MYMSNTKTEQGYISLTATLLISAVLLLVLSQSVLRSSLSTNILTEIYQTTDAHTLGFSCAELATEHFFSNSSLGEGTEIGVAQGTCTVLTITYEQINKVTLLVRAANNDTVSTLGITFDTENPETTTTTWAVH